MRERIQKIISAAGLMSRRAAEKCISEGRVRVNGVTAALGDTADAGTDIIEVDGKRVTSAEKKVYIMLNKPVGYVTTMSDEQGRPCVASLVRGCPARVYPVGRLDMYSEGLLVFTNDGDTANRLMHPRYGHGKSYELKVHGDIDRCLEILSAPIRLSERTVQGKVELISREGDTARLKITITEGLNRQVRRMCDAAGLKVELLRRVSEAGLVLGDLPVGQWRYLTENEIQLIKNC